MTLICLYDSFYDRICPAHRAHVGSQKAHTSLCLEQIGGKVVHLVSSDRRRHVALPFLLRRPTPPGAVHVVHPSLQRKLILHATVCMSQISDPN